MREFIKINPADNVAVAMAALSAGSVCEGVTLTENIGAGHKFALQPIKRGEKIIKYGMPIAIASEDVPAGAWVHTHNIKTGLGELLEYEYTPDFKPLEPVTSEIFMGFERPDGRAGVRNEIWVIPTVGCVADVAAAMAKEAEKFVHGSVDCVTALTHPYGCSQLGEDRELTCRILADFARHPNAGGVLLLGLGCENTGVADVEAMLGDYDRQRIRTMICQEHEDEMSDGLAVLRELIDNAAVLERTEISADRLVVGLKCGGSDGFSGITANPAVGVFSDMLNARGGATMLTEVPEMFGAEQLLMSRCRDRETFDKTVALINDFKEYFMRYDQPVYENPSPGNKAGGISTLEDKSMGCTQKAGSAPVCGVLKYGERIAEKGLHLLQAPGNDLVASTALAASGAQIVLFTTGRGTPFACPVPTVKISTNPTLAQRKKGWIDFNAGTIVEGESIESCGARLFEYVLRVASGEKVCSERAGFHSMAIFKQGVTL